MMKLKCFRCGKWNGKQCACEDGQTLFCGDGREILPRLKHVEVDLYLTDPPYNVSYVGKTKDALTIENDQMKDGDFRKFLVDSFSAAHEIMKPGAVFYIWHAEINNAGYTFRGACNDVGWKVRECLVWIKDVMVMSRQDYHWQHEPCLYGWKDGAAHQWENDRKQTTTMFFKRPNKSTEHPTMKPVRMIKYQICNSSKVGQIVLDSFVGSGTTLVACRDTGRRGIGIELSEDYCHGIAKRLNRPMKPSLKLDSYQPKKYITKGFDLIKKKKIARKK